MSYDLDIRTRPPFGPGLPLEQVAAELLRYPGVERRDTTNFLLDRDAAGVHVWMTIAYQDNEEDEGTETPTAVNIVYLSIPYPLLDRTWPVAMQIAGQVAERFGWSVYDPQAESDVTSESEPLALDVEALVSGPSVVELFIARAWPRSLWSATVCFALGTMLAIWLLLALERPREDFDRYVPYLSIAGAIAVCIAKGIVQATWHYLRHPRTDQSN